MRGSTLDVFCGQSGPPRGTVLQQEDTMGRWFIATMVAVLLSGSAAMAQTSTSSPGMLPTSPLGIQGGRPVGPAGIPMGATGLATGGLSPLPSGTSIYGSSTGSNLP